ncbi:MULTISPECIES: carbohydrate ABC transporter permease [Paenibacillus]|uniref:Carbohydrate ABC transporter permease n=1 Tax=Paenibacillus baimaensis TaxID=2982185 RepID=A0ABT2U9F0_9BACL|nr:MULTISPECIES: carbohydrate ABC transporter permease [unclassified Paenibacillus]MCU6791267.1 carbohydrate ABC transporter permease [Paenibacillus sp. WQ 127069]OMF19000.1 sugar ABC transporter permease [Paenibacillus sp. FSL H7-0331]
MNVKRSKAEIIFGFFNISFLLFLTLITLYPFLYVAFASLSNPSSLASHSGLLLWPLGFNVDGYINVFKNPNIITGYTNTIIYVVVGTIINVFMTALGAYVLSRKGVMLRDPMMMIIVFTLFFSGGLIPNYLLVRSLGMFDTMWALILPGAISTYNLIIMRTSFAAIPDSLEESARIDGANDITILFKIVLPLSQAVISVMILFYAVAHWNSWFSAMIYLRNRDAYPLQLFLREILINSSTDSMITGSNGNDKEAVSEIVKYCTIIIATLPIIAVYPFMQKYFTKGVMIGAVKG